MALVLLHVGSGLRKYCPTSAVMALVLLFSSLWPLAAPAASPSDRDPVRYIVTFEEAARGPVNEYVRQAGGAVAREHKVLPAMLVLLDERRASRLREIAGVRSVEPDSGVVSSDVELDSSWEVKRIGAGLVHSQNGGAGVRIAIIDSGVDYTHPDLRGRYRGGYDFVNGDADPMDDRGHGTHVAGIAAAELNGAGVVGVAPLAEIYAVKVLDQTGRGRSSDVLAGIEWAIAHGMQVINLSLGTDNYDAAVRAAVKAAWDVGIVLVAAAGNTGVGSVTYPAKYDEVIAVGATDAQDVRRPACATGPELELMAPGSSVLSTMPGGGYATKSGTSMASPVVAGVAALIIASGISDANGNGRINDEVRLRLQQTVYDLGATGRDDDYGFGLVDAVKATGG